MIKSDKIKSIDFNVGYYNRYFIIESLDFKELLNKDMNIYLIKEALKYSDLNLFIKVIKYGNTNINNNSFISELNSNIIKKYNILLKEYILNYHKIVDELKRNLLKENLLIPASYLSSLKSLIDSSDSFIILLENSGDQIPFENYQNIVDSFHSILSILKHSEASQFNIDNTLDSKF